MNLTLFMRNPCKLSNVSTGSVAAQKLGLCMHGLAFGIAKSGATPDDWCIRATDAQIGRLGDVV